MRCNLIEFKMNSSRQFSTCYTERLLVATQYGTSDMFTLAQLVRARKKRVKQPLRSTGIAQKTKLFALNPNRMQFLLGINAAAENLQCCSTRPKLVCV